jgi:hypothetical protein
MVTVPYGQSAVMTLSLNSSSTTPGSYPGAALEFFDFRVIDKAVFEPLNTSATNENTRCAASAAMRATSTLPG